MRRLFLVLLAVSSSLWAQTVTQDTIPKIVDLQPRYQRGESQKFRMQVEVLFLNDEGKPTAVKHNHINYTQLCIANTPDTGLVHEIAVDSFVIGAVRSVGPTDRESMSLVDSIAGLNFRVQYRSAVPVKGSCYDVGIPLTKGWPYLEAWEFVDDFLPARILEQLHYTASKRLKKVGDSVTIAWPKPICYGIEKVVTKSSVQQKPFKLKLTGITSYAGTPCATVSIASAVSPYRVDMYRPDTTVFKAVGTSQITGELQISLKDGSLLNAKMSEKLNTDISETGVKTRKNRVVKNTELILRVR